jgi:hypothetical protein
VRESKSLVCFHRQMGQALDHVFSYHPGIVGGSAAEDINALVRNIITGLQPGAQTALHTIDAILPGSVLSQGEDIG